MTKVQEENYSLLKEIRMISRGYKVRSLHDNVVYNCIDSSEEHYTVLQYHYREDGSPLQFHSFTIQPNFTDKTIVCLEFLTNYYNDYEVSRDKRDNSNKDVLDALLNVTLNCFLKTIKVNGILEPYPEMERLLINEDIPEEHITMYEPSNNEDSEDSPF